LPIIQTLQVTVFSQRKALICNKMTTLLNVTFMLAAEKSHPIVQTKSPPEASTVGVQNECKHSQNPNIASYLKLTADNLMTASHSLGYAE